MPPLSDIHENRGLGLSGTDTDGRLWKLGSARWAMAAPTDVPPGDVFLSCDSRLMAALHLRDEIRPGARDLISYLHLRGIEPILLSGDREQRVKELADDLGIRRWYASQLPEDKLRMVQALEAEMPSAMVGDGINDAPALESASVGISLVDSTRAARDAAGVVLLGGRPDQLIEAFALARHTLLTVRQNLFWAFFYNVLAIPIAAFGFLSPMIAAGAMAFSDLMVIGNSLRLKVKKIRELGASAKATKQPAFSGEGAPVPGQASGKPKAR
jgi:Cu+-exporting ATPase